MGQWWSLQKHTQTIHKRHFSQDTLHQSPGQDPLTQAWCPTCKAVGLMQSYSVAALPSRGSSSCWRSHLRSGMLECENKTASQLFQVSSEKYGREKHQWVWEHPSHQCFFQISMGVLCPAFLCLSAQGKTLPSTLYRQLSLNPESRGSPAHGTRWVQCTDHPHSSVTGAAWSAVRMYVAITTISALTYCIVYLTSRLLPLSSLAKQM